MTALVQCNPDDYQLVQLATGGNQQAYAVLMDRYRNNIQQTILKMVHNRDDAEDLTLEAFSKAFRKLSTYSPTYAFSTWLFRIAINNCIDHIRKRRLHTLSIDETFEPDGDTHYSDYLRAGDRNPEEEIIYEQRKKITREVIGQLSEKYRLMFELRYFEELSYDEIATELDIPLGTVKAQLFRAKEMLYELLQKPGASAYFETTKRRK
ncbi:MAG: sigma-70 family RNA polymerase sigma factor [Bacteroidota bacterium]